MPFIKPLPEKDFYAVIFSSVKSDSLEGYREMDEKVMALASTQPGYLGYESVANGDKSIFISYWETREAIEAWSRDRIHLEAKGHAPQWYRRYLSQICRVERSQLFGENPIIISPER